MYRSGSTWLFNAVRLCQAGTLPNLTGYPPRIKPGVNIVKLHEYDNDLKNKADFIFTTYRSMEDTKASMVRSKEVALEGFTGKGEVERFDQLFDEYMMYVINSDLVIHYDRIMNDPVSQVVRIASILGVEVNATKIANELKELRPPEEGWDPVTFLHQNHFTSR